MMELALDKYLDHLRVERALLPATLESYARDLQEYLAWLREARIIEITKITELHVVQHVASLQRRGLSRSSQARHLASVRGLHKFAAAEGLCTLDPAAGVSSTRGSRPLP